MLVAVDYAAAEWLIAPRFFKGVRLGVARAGRFAVAVALYGDRDVAVWRGPVRAGYGPATRDLRAYKRLVYADLSGRAADAEWLDEQLA